MLHDLTLRNSNKHECFGVVDVAHRRGFRFVRLVVEQNGAQERARSRRFTVDQTKQVPLSIRRGYESSRQSGQGTPADTEITEPNRPK
jgi:hypothetical protein